MSVAAATVAPVVDAADSTDSGILATVTSTAGSLMSTSVAVLVAAAAVLPGVAESAAAGPASVVELAT